MGEVIEVDWSAVRAKRDQARAQAMAQAADHMTQTGSQACVLKLAEMRLTDTEYVELCAAIMDYDCYNEADAHIQLLVDIYQMLEAWS